MLPFEDIPVHIRDRVFRDIGEATTCRETIEGAVTFDAENATRISLELCQFIIELIEEAKQI
jgi:hypothetical protein